MTEKSNDPKTSNDHNRTPNLIWSYGGGMISGGLLGLFGGVSIGAAIGASIAFILVWLTHPPKDKPDAK